MNSTRRILLAGIIFAAYATRLLVGSTAGQETKTSTPSVTYSQVIDRAFQFSLGMPSEFRGIAYRIVVRYLPSSGAPESQVVLLKGSDGKVHLSEYTLQPGARTIAVEYNEAMRRNPSSAIDDILRGVAIRKRELVARDSDAQLLRDFSRLSIPVEFDTGVCTDGTIYELWVQAPSNSIHASFSDCAYGEGTDEVPVIRWIRAVHLVFER